MPTTPTKYLSFLIFKEIMIVIVLEIIIVIVIVIQADHSDKVLIITNEIMIVIIIVLKILTPTEYFSDSKSPS